MAFETLSSRTASALILGPLFLYVVFLGGPFLAVLLAVISLVCIHEFATMARQECHGPICWLGYAGTLAVHAGAYFHGFVGAATAMTLFPLFLLLPYLRAQEFSKATIDISLMTFAVFEYSYFLSFVTLIRAEATESYPALFCLLVLVWMQDSVAYFVGSAIGRTPLTTISPKKSWEGTLAGLAGAVLAAALLWQYGFGKQLQLSTVLLLAIVAILAQLGDISESLLKRNFGVKDSGQVIPGHGGLLDRFDSLFYSAPAMYLLHSWM